MYKSFVWKLSADIYLIIMDFSFLSFSAFQLLYALPLLVVPYLLRERGKRIVVPALFLYEGLSSTARRRLWGRLRLTPLFFLQLLILSLLVVSAARPVLQRPRSKTAIILDTSASMQANAPTAAGSLFDQANRQANTILDTLPATDTIGLFTTAPVPTPFSTPSAIRTQVQQDFRQITVTDTPDPSDEVLSVFLNQLLEEQDFQQIFFFTDRPLAEPLDTPALTVVSLGEPQPNLGITAFRLYRSPFVPDEVDATVVVEGAESLSGWSVGIEDRETGKVLQSQALIQDAVPTFSFPHLPLAQTYRARLFVEDSLAIDNQAYAVLPDLTSVSGLLVTPSSDVSKSLNQIPNLTLKSITPQEYDPAQAAGVPFVLFHLTAPETLPPTNAAFLLPPEGNALFPLGQSALQPRMTKWLTGHPLTVYVNFSLLTPPYGQAFLPVSWGKPVLHATVGPLVLAGERKGRRYAGVGFDLLPYLGKRNLPTSILTLNLLGWLANHAGQPPGLKTGASLEQQDASVRIRLPDGALASSIGGRILLTQQGIYTVSENTTERRIAVNLLNAAESRLGRPLRLTLPPRSRSGVAQQTDQPLWPWFLVAVLLLLGLEWWLAARSGEAVRTA